MAIITTVVNQKGGTGKTTTAMNLGVALASSKKKVMLIDMDPHSCLTYSFGISHQNGAIADVLEGSKTLNEILVEKEGLFVAPSSTKLADIELLLVNVPRRENYLLQSIYEFEGFKKFDHIIIDSPPSLSILTINALKAADELLVPLQPEVLNLQGLIGLLDTVQEIRRVFKKPLPVKGILLIRHNPRSKLNNEVAEYIKNNLKERLFETFVRNSVKITESPSHAKSVINYSPKSRGAKDFMSLAEEFLK